MDNRQPESGHPEKINLDIQGAATGNPEMSAWDNQTTNLGQPTDENFDSQTKQAGFPKNAAPDSLIASPEKRLSKKTGLDSKISSPVFLDSPDAGKKPDWTKYDKKRKSKGVFLRTADAITKKFKQFCIENDWDFSQGTELAWNKLMSDLDSQALGSLDSLIAQDDRRLKMMFKTKPFIINLYLRYNSAFNELASGDGKKWSARWSPRDDEAALRYNDVTAAIVELGILQTQIQKGFRTSRIQTFKYYTDEIEKVLASGVQDEMLETILKYHRQIWKNQTGKEIDLSFLEETGK